MTPLRRRYVAICSPSSREGAVDRDLAVAKPIDQQAPSKTTSSTAFGSSGSTASRARWPSAKLRAHSSCSNRRSVVLPSSTTKTAHSPSRCSIRTSFLGELITPFRCLHIVEARDVFRGNHSAFACSPLVRRSPTKHQRARAYSGAKLYDRRSRIATEFVPMSL